MAQKTLKLKRRLYQTLVESFDEGEFRTLCFDLGVDYDSLGSDGKADRARELVGHFWRRGALMTLLQRVEALRPLARHGAYFRRVLSERLHDTQEINVDELRRMGNTGPMGIDLKTVLLLNDRINRLRLVVWGLVALVGVQVVLVLVLVIMRVIGEGY